MTVRQHDVRCSEPLLTALPHHRQVTEEGAEAERLPILGPKYDRSISSPAVKGSMIVFLSLMKTR